VVFEPSSLARDILGLFVHPFPVVAYCTALSGVLLVAYLVFYAFTHVTASPASPAASLSPRRGA